MIVIKASNGNGGVTIGGTGFLFDAVYEDSASGTARITIANTGTATGLQNTVSGPTSWTWLNSGDAEDYEIYCQPTSGSVENGSTDVNKWKGLNETRTWIRRNQAGQSVTMILSIRDVATQTVRATCTITLQDD